MSARALVRTICLASFLLSGTNSAAAEEGLPPKVVLLNPDQIKWEKTPSGRELAYLYGHPKKPGVYLYLVKWPPNNTALAHTHPDDRYGMVVSGTHYIGYGEHFDETRLHANPAGSYFTEPANQPHFGMTKGEGTILFFYGMGPSANNELERSPSQK